MTKVLFLPEVVDQFLELAEILYKKDYLGLKEVAIDYSEQLFRDIQKNLPLKVKKDAPSYFQRYGNDLFYSSFSKNKNTTWYVFYSIHKKNDETILLVRYLGNNHVIAHHLVDDNVDNQ